MFETIRARLIVIALLAAVAIGAMWKTYKEPLVSDRQLPDGTVIQDTSHSPIRLGLDLQGGIHMALELDESRGQIRQRSQAIDRALSVIRNRIDEFGVAEPLVQKEGANRIIVELPGVTDPERAKSIVQRSAFLAFHLTDKDDAFRRVLPAMDRALRAAGVTEASASRSAAARAAADSARDSARAAGQRQPAAPSTAVEDLLGGGQDTAKATAPDSAQSDTSALLGGDTGVLTPLLLQGSQTPGHFMVELPKVGAVMAMLSRPEAQRLIPRTVILRWGDDTLSRSARSYRSLYALQARPMMTGEYLVDADARLDPVYNQATVQFQLNRRGGRIFERETGQHIGDYMAIMLDTLVKGQPPIIRGQIGTHGQIEMASGTLADAQELAIVLKAGALPAPLQIVEERTVGPSLGEDSINSATVAGIVSVSLIVLIMIGYYRFSGVLAVAALSLYVLFTLGGLAAIGATLTLPGLAGFVLSIGMAVDANVLIFERIREELALGKSVRLSVDAGFKMALNAIVDSNVTTILTALFLYQFGTGPVRGFATTLILGVLASMITAVFVTRTFYLIYLERRPDLKTVSI
jgi:preprotein translocase subunit SecD